MPPVAISVVEGVSFVNDSTLFSFPLSPASLISSSLPYWIVLITSQRPRSHHLCKSHLHAHANDLRFALHNGKLSSRARTTTKATTTKAKRHRSRKSEKGINVSPRCLRTSRATQMMVAWVAWRTRSLAGLMWRAAQAQGRSGNQIRLFRRRTMAIMWSLCRHMLALAVYW